MRRSRTGRDYNSGPTHNRERWLSDEGINGAGGVWCAAAAWAGLPALRGRVVEGRQRAVLLVWAPAEGAGRVSIKVCTSDYMLSTVDGMDMRRNWFPRVVAEAFLESTKDGEISRSPDPVTMIDGDLSWFNNSPDPRVLSVQVQRAPRSIVAQNPSTVVIHDAWTFAKGVSPTADYPSIIQDAFGGRTQVDRPENRAEDLRYARFFVDGDSSAAWVEVGEVPSMHSLHFRYLCAVQTPGTWTAPSEFEPRWEAQARWARLRFFATPVGSA